MDDLRPLLQIVHVSDLHVVAPDFAGWPAARRLAPWAHGRWPALPDQRPRGPVSASGVVGRAAAPILGARGRGPPPRDRHRAGRPAREHPRPRPARPHRAPTRRDRAGVLWACSPAGATHPGDAPPDLGTL